MRGFWGAGQDYEDCIQFGQDYNCSTTLTWSELTAIVSGTPGAIIQGDMNSGDIYARLNGSDVYSLIGYYYYFDNPNLSSGNIVPLVNPLASLLSAFAEGPVGRTIQNGVNLLGCTSNAIAGEIPFVGKYLSNSPDPVGNKLRTAAKAISPNPDAKTLGLIPNNLAVNTQRVVTTLDKLDLPQLSEAAAAASSKFAPYAPAFSKVLGIAGASYMAYNTVRNTSTCYQANKGTVYLP